MNLKPQNQIQLHGLKNYFNELTDLFDKNKLPNKILLSGPKGIGKSTLAYHLINYILSSKENSSYDKKNNIINKESKCYKLIQNGSHPNFYLIDIVSEKKNIDISQIRNLISDLRMSSLNDNPKIILIDNIHYLNKNSINTLLKTLEEPGDNTFFILINSNKEVLPTLKSRCLNFKIMLPHDEVIKICNKIINDDIYNIINKDLLDYYISPGKIFNLIKFSKENSIDIKNIKLDEFLSMIIDKNFFKKETPITESIYDFFEFFLLNQFSPNYVNFYNYFVNQIHNIKTFNLDEETIMLEFKHKFLNG